MRQLQWTGGQGQAKREKTQVGAAGKKIKKKKKDSLPDGDKTICVHVVSLPGLKDLGNTSGYSVLWASRGQTWDGHLVTKVTVTGQDAGGRAAVAPRTATAEEGGGNIGDVMKQNMRSGHTGE